MSQQTIPNAASAAAPFQSASLYVGDLLTDLTEGVLFELFNKVGPVASIRVCRDAVTRRSLGYAYVNFHNVQDAERALDTMNFTEIKADPSSAGKPCRIMWSQRDPTLRKTGVGNIFVKNLPPSVDNKMLFDTFSDCGNILSCKVATDDQGVSKGYGYVHFETAEGAREAIDKYNLANFEGHVVSVLPFQGRTARPATFTNLYVKQFPLSFDEAALSDLFATCGEIASVFVSRDAEGKSRGFGFVNFKSQAGAERAVAELHGRQVEDASAPAVVAEDGSSVPATTSLYVNRAQKRADRNRDIKAKLAAKNEENLAKYSGMNLYIKNLDETIQDDYFRDIFSKYGTITSARIMRDAEGNSKGFGFVCYSSAEEATRAVQDQNGKILKSKPLYVALHQRKEVRLEHLRNTYAPRNARFMPQGMGMPFPGNPVYLSPQQLYQQQQQQQRAQQQPFMFPQQGPGGFRPPGGPVRGPMGGAGSPYGNPNLRQFSPQQMGGPQGYPQQFPQGYRGPGPLGGPQGQPQQGGRIIPGMMLPQQQFGRPGGRGPLPPQQPQFQQMQQQQQVGRGGYPSPGRIPQQQPQYLGMPIPPHLQQQQRAAGYKLNPNVRNPQMIPAGVMMQGGGGGVPQGALLPQGHEALDDQVLAAADPQQQKNMIGEKLYPLIHQHQPVLAGKITGMLLEMDNAELLNLIESPDALLHKIDEALNVLQNHKSSDE